MRRRLAGALMIMLCLLTACGQGKNEGDSLALQIRTEAIAMLSCSGQVEILVDYGDRVYNFVLDFSYEKDGNSILTVVEPETLSDIKVTIEKGETILSYDGASLETGLLSADGLSPVSALPFMLSEMKDGYIAECVYETYNEKDTLHVCIRDPEAQAGSGTETNLWFDTESHAPVHAELSVDGFTVIQCDFITFLME